MAQKPTAKWLPIGSIIPYENNPRNNETAVSAVIESIQSFGFLVPIVIDKDNVIAAGHTRLEAAQRLGLKEVFCVSAADLTPKQIAAFRLIDNKTAELATWDFDLLSAEVTALEDSGIDLKMYGWGEEELDCLRQIVSEDSLDLPAQEPTTQPSHITKDARSVTVSVGEFRFFVDVTKYNEWAEAIRKKNDYSNDRVLVELAQRLEMTPQDRKRVAKESQGGRQVIVRKLEKPTIASAPTPRARVRQ